MEIRAITAAEEVVLLVRQAVEQEGSPAAAAEHVLPLARKWGLGRRAS
tara:strand:+ start:781 stop:924 length:144 start_codon:yes stop_codon:yes gene_type:complete